MTIFVPPVKTQGIKTKLVPWILSYAPSNLRWIEPFMGSGVVGFNYKPREAIFCDLNKHIINFYISIRTGMVTPQGVENALNLYNTELQTKGEEFFYMVRQTFNTQPDMMYHFLFLTQTCFNGVMRFNSRGEFNTPFCKDINKLHQRRIHDLSNRIKYLQSLISNGWNFKCQSFEQTFESVQPNDFIYCDPPYLGLDTKYYEDWTMDNEMALFKCLCETKARFILSTWYSKGDMKNPNLSRYEGKFRIETTEHYYQVGPRKENRGAVVEALVMNFKKE